MQDKTGHIAGSMLSHQLEYIEIRKNGHLQLIRLDLELSYKLRRIYTLTRHITKDYVRAEVAAKF